VGVDASPPVGAPREPGLLPIVLSSLLVFVVTSLAIGVGLAGLARDGSTTAPAATDAPAVRLERDALARAGEAAGCRTLREREPLPDRSHVDRADAPPLDELYPDTRPTHSGPHTAQLHPVVPPSDRQLDELTLTHNLEHGAVVVWYDPDALDAGEVTRLGEQVAARNDAGFDVGGAGSAVFVSPYTDPGIGSGGALALRAWGTAVDCDRYDPVVVDGFLAAHFGDRGIAPERHLAPYPAHVLDLAGP
jgi:hypothetical protein